MHLGKAAALEVCRCERAIRNGNPIAFWQSRIGACLDEVNRARVILEGCLKWLNRGAPNCNDPEQMLNDGDTET